MQCCGSTALLISRIAKGGSVRLAEAGCTPHEIAAITGHASLKEIVRYTATADRKRLRDQRDGEGENQNIECQTGREV